MSYFIFTSWSRSLTCSLALGFGSAVVMAGSANTASELASYLSVQGMQARIEHRSGLLIHACRGRSTEIDRLLSESEQLYRAHQSQLDSMIAKTRERLQRDIGIEEANLLYQDLKGEQDEAALYFRQTFQLASAGAEPQCLQAIQVHLRLQKEIDALLN